jgi:hypothetical protein
MIPLKQSANIEHTFLEALYNIHLSKWKSVVENVFEILKMNFRGVLFKGNLHILFIVDVVTCCMLYNLILDGRDVDVDALML